ncbi:hydro-lyase, Fe-S type, tartrate/fumarate subfamily, beta subunit [Dehalogenimonas lykanthroporepellens BL-DC-9]|nr:hydro-lyase, Fe-S type, tartrate/fumarate subfamily, beta subunit [Dehalogenimonas lykanthroporepellens BL-DC-9]
MTEPQWREIRLPLPQEVLDGLRAGDRLLLSGTIYAARDAAHKKFIETLDKGQELPLELASSVIYYMGPTPARPGEIIGACGPTTSARMDRYTPRLIAGGLRVMMGKGDRSAEVIEAMKKHGAVYLTAIGGAGALLSLRVSSVETVAYPELGTEAVLKMEIERFPAVVAIDAEGNNLFDTGPRQYRVISEEV